MSLLPLSVRRAFCVLIALALFGAPGRALELEEDGRASFLPGIPWLQRIVQAGIVLQVDLEPLGKAEDGALREKDRVAVRLRVSDVATGQPLDGLDAVAWMSPAAAGQGIDPERCPAEAREIVAEGTPEPLREADPGTYETVARLGRPGRYELVFFVGSPRLVHCFQVEVRPRGERAG